MSELKPCPFCGNDEAEIGHDGGHEFGVPSWLVSCGACWAQVCAGDVDHLSEAEAAGMWNRRATEEPDRP